MSTNPPPHMVMSLWEKLAAQEMVYAVFIDRSVPFMEDPELMPQEGYLPEDVIESVLMVFITQESAENYMEFLPEIHDDLRPSQFSVMAVKKIDLMEMIVELNEISEGQYGASVRIDLADQLDEDSLIADTLYSKYLLKS